MSDMRFRAMHGALQGIVNLAKSHTGSTLKKARSGEDDADSGDTNNDIGLEELKAEQDIDNPDSGLDEQGYDDEADNTTDEVAPTEIHGKGAEADANRLKSLRNKIQAAGRKSSK